MRVSRPIEVVVLNCWVTETNETPLASKFPLFSRSRRGTGSAGRSLIPKKRGRNITQGRQLMTEGSAELTAHTRGATVLSDAPSQRYEMAPRSLQGDRRGAVLSPCSTFTKSRGARRALRGRHPDIAIVKAEAEAYIRFPKAAPCGAGRAPQSRNVAANPRAFADMTKRTGLTQRTHPS